MADYDVAALGAGVAGLIAALRTARSGRSVALVTSHLLQPGDAPRIDAVPAQYLALLVELGVSPNAVGADLAPPFSRAAWECAASQSTPGPQTAHVERPALELALLALLRREHHATICFAPRLRPGQNLAASSWRARKIIDASLPALSQMRANKAKPASVQWSEGPGLRIGDAALARDALSSQGLVAGSTEGLLAAAWEDETDLRSIQARQCEQRRAHLRSLLGTIERC